MIFFWYVILLLTDLYPLDALTLTFVFLVLLI